MKFADIPQFTRAGSYEIDVMIGFLEGQLKDYEETYGLELNPDFQRGNVWTEKQQIDFLEFFFRGGKTARVIYFNCGVWDDGDETKTDIPQMVCVDGLQRLTSFLRFIHNEIPIFGHYYKEFEDQPRTHFTIKFNVNNLRKKKDVLKWYIEMNTGGTVHSDSEIQRVTEMMKELEKGVIYNGNRISF